RLRRLGLASRLLLQIHDELLLECPPGEVEVVKKEVREAMEGSITLRVPLSVDIGVGKNWLESK
ncbi:MAG: hypothetical protein LBU79_06780, partial [Planctomycetota bacterium]|nr:hypothetical protein [Planctomycetota bacterium]